MVQPIIQANSEHILREMELADYGEHNLLIYPNLTTLTKVYSQYIKSRLQANMELILFLSSYQSVNQVRSILRHNGLDLARHEGNGSLVILALATVKEIKEIVKSTKHCTEGCILGIKCDVSQASEIDYVVKSTIENFRSIDILVNNAGIVYVKKLIDTSEKEWDKTMYINLKGAFLFSKAVLPFMLKNGDGVIINVSSGAGKTGFPDISAYRASKFGMIGLTESLAWEVGNYNIKVMAICPGEVDTKMQHDVDLGYYAKNKDKMIKPNQVAERIIDMIFDYKGKYDNGQSIDIG